MRLEQLEYVSAVNRYGSLRRAGEHLHVSQPALSEAIAKLERELRVTLLERHRSGARISPAGRELLPVITEVLDAVQRVRAVAADELVARRTLRLGTVNAGTAALALPAVREFQAGHPAAAVEIRSLQQDEIVVGLVDGSLDLGLINALDGDDVPPPLDSEPLVAGPPVAVLASGHPLARREVVTVDELRAERFIGMRPGFLMHRYAHRLFGADLPASWHTGDGAEMGKLMVAEGIGLTVLPDFSVLDDPLHRAGLITTRPIAGDRTVVTMCAVWLRRPRVPPPVRDMLDLLRARAERVAGAVPSSA